MTETEKFIYLCARGTLQGTSGYAGFTIEPAEGQTLEILWVRWEGEDPGSDIGTLRFACGVGSGNALATDLGALPLFYLNSRSYSTGNFDDAFVPSARCLVPYPEKFVVGLDNFKLTTLSGSIAVCGILHNYGIPTVAAITTATISTLLAYEDIYIYKI